MQQTLMVFQAVIAVLLMLAILSQQKGTGLSSTFGGSGTFYTSKRGAEKFLSIATVILAALFILNAVLFLFIK